MPNEKIRFIINNLQESLTVEVKNWLDGLNDNNVRAKLAKEIIALANNGGGHIVIGFAENGAAFDEIAPEPGQFDAFSQDAISALVHRFIAPPCQCTVETASPEGSDIEHPVIVVPGNHRTPLFAVRGCEDGSLQSGKVYVRRPGGLSEEARNQDDWEKLIDRLVRARQTDLLGAIREILDPSDTVVPPQQRTLEEWRQENYAAWRQIVEQFDADDPRRLAAGHWSVAFRIDPFQTENLNQLNAALDHEMPNHSGWPPFTYLHRDPVRPQAQDDSIVAYLGRLADGEAAVDRDHADYWRVSRDGRGFLLRPMQEDRPNYPGEIYPPPVGPFFDWVFPIYRSAEVLKFIEALNAQFGAADASFEMQLNYYNTQNRKLETGTRNYILNDGAACAVDAIEAAIQANVSEIETNLEELVYTLLVPVYEQFQFTDLPRQLVTSVVTDVLATRF